MADCRPYGISVLGQNALVQNYGVSPNGGVKPRSSKFNSRWALRLSRIRGLPTRVLSPLSQSLFPHARGQSHVVQSIRFLPLCLVCAPFGHPGVWVVGTCPFLLPPPPPILLVFMTVVCFAMDRCPFYPSSILTPSICPSVNRPIVQSLDGWGAYSLIRARKEGAGSFFDSKRWLVQGRVGTYPFLRGGIEHHGWEAGSVLFPTHPRIVPMRTNPIHSVRSFLAIDRAGGKSNGGTNRSKDEATKRRGSTLKVRH